MELAEALGILGINIDADERTIRRAYAVRLKKIDQLQEPEAFARLRAAYERLLARDSAPHSERRVLPVPQPYDPSRIDTPPPEPRAATAQGPDASTQRAAAMAQEVGERLIEGFMAQYLMIIPTPKSDRATQATALLESFLQDPELLDFNVLHAFEFALLRRIFGQWRLGHDDLLQAGDACFAWAADVRRLENFGYYGVLAAKAVEQYRTCAKTYARRWALYKRHVEAHQGQIDWNTLSNPQGLIEIIWNLPEFAELCFGPELVMQAKARFAAPLASKTSRSIPVQNDTGNAFLRDQDTRSGSMSVRMFLYAGCLAIFVIGAIFNALTEDPPVVHPYPYTGPTVSSPPSRQPELDKLPPPPGIERYKRDGYKATGNYFPRNGRYLRQYCRLLDTSYTCKYIDVYTGVEGGVDAHAKAAVNSARPGHGKVEAHVKNEGYSS